MQMVNVAMTKKEVERVLGMVDNSEYKRRQSPPGIKITPKAFGKDRRMPITNKYKRRAMIYCRDSLYTPSNSKIYTQRVPGYRGAGAFTS